MNRLVVFYILLFTVASLSFSQDKKYFFTYVVFGNAMTSGHLEQKEKVYRYSDILKTNKLFKASFGYYSPDKLGDYTLINVGPYETEIVCHDELVRQILIIEKDGYSLAEKKHAFPTIVLTDYTPK